MTHNKPKVRIDDRKHRVVVKACKSVGFVIDQGHQDDNVQLFWVSSSEELQKLVPKLNPCQRINHFLGMPEISSKEKLARNVNKSRDLCPRALNLTPKTWIIPTEIEAFNSYRSKLKPSSPDTFIVKPVTQKRGRGIKLVQNDDANFEEYCDKILVQEYIENPLLDNGFKFDLRLYVLVTSCDPLEIYLCKEGLWRKATEKYERPHHLNLTNEFMHLTNYHINTESENFQRNSKQSLTEFSEWLRANKVDEKLLWTTISNDIVKAMIIVQPYLKRAYYSSRPNTGDSSVCFEILGFDILIDTNFKPWILEVNQSPNVSHSERVDCDVKNGVLQGAFSIIKETSWCEELYEVDCERTDGLFMKICPSENAIRQDDYRYFLKVAEYLSQETDHLEMSRTAQKVLSQLDMWAINCHGKSQDETLSIFLELENNCEEIKKYCLGLTEEQITKIGENFSQKIIKIVEQAYGANENEEDSEKIKHLLQITLGCVFSEKMKHLWKPFENWENDFGHISLMEICCIFKLLRLCRECLFATFYNRRILDK